MIIELGLSFLGWPVSLALYNVEPLCAHKFSYFVQLYLLLWPASVLLVVANAKKGHLNRIPDWCAQ